MKCRKRVQGSLRYGAWRGASRSGVPAFNATLSSVQAEVNSDTSHLRKSSIAGVSSVALQSVVKRFVPRLLVFKVVNDGTRVV